MKIINAKDYVNAIDCNKTFTKEQKIELATTLQQLCSINYSDEPIYLDNLILSIHLSQPLDLENIIDNDVIIKLIVDFDNDDYEIFSNYVAKLRQ